MADVIAKAFNVKLIEVLTGFKYIGEQIKLLKKIIPMNIYLDLRKAMAV